MHLRKTKIALLIISNLLLNVVRSISRHPILIVISYDAFRYNLFDTKLVPNMERLKYAGTYADHMISIFPTKTFPNHFSIATGLYAETHGAIGANYYHTKEQILKKKSAETFQYNNDVVPIWRWNEDLDNDRHSGSIMWPGSEYEYQGKTVTYFQRFTRKIEQFKLVDKVMSWLTDPIKPANLIMFYVEGIDHPAHHFGPKSVQFEEALKKLDNLTKYIEDQLEKHQLSERANVIHLSDHGIIGVPYSNIINITRYLTKGTYTMVGASPFLQIYPKDGYQQEIYELLKAGSVENGHFKVYKKERFPKRWHFSHNPRIADILVMADICYALEDLYQFASRVSKKHNYTLTANSEFGVHGYDYTVMDMRPFFMARGPRFKKNHQVDPFYTTDLYNLFTEILKIPKKPNNGSMSRIINIVNQTTEIPIAVK